MGNSNPKGTGGAAEQVPLSATLDKRNDHSENIPSLNSASSAVVRPKLSDPRSPTQEYTRTPIYSRTSIDSQAASPSAENNTSLMLHSGSVTGTLAFEEMASEPESELNQVTDMMKTFQCRDTAEDWTERKASPPGNRKASTLGSKSKAASSRSGSQERQTTVLNSPSAFSVKSQDVVFDRHSTFTPRSSQSSAKRSNRGGGILASLRSPSSCKQYERIDDE